MSRADGWRAPRGRLGAELDQQTSAGMQLAGGDPRPVECGAVEGDRLHVLRSAVRVGLDEADRVDHEGAAPDPDTGARERRRIHEHQVLARHGEQTQRRPHVPRTQTAGIVVAGQTPAARRELVLDDGVHDLGGAVRATDVVIGPRHFHVGLVVQTLEAVEGVTRSDRVRVGGDAELLHRRLAEPEEAIEQPAERRLSAGQVDAGRHVVGEAERVVPAAPLVERGVDEQSGVRIERIDPLGRHRVELAGEVVVADVPRHLSGAVVAEGEVEGVGDRMGDATLQELLAVVASQVVVHVHQRPVPVDLCHTERHEVGEERVRQGAALP